jgi:hypothetical protein
MKDETQATTAGERVTRYDRRSLRGGTLPHKPIIAEKSYRALISFVRKIFTVQTARPCYSVASHHTE